MTAYRCTALMTIRTSVAAGALALALVACGGGDDSDDDGLDVDACLEEAATREERDTCTMAERAPRLFADG